MPVESDGQAVGTVDGICTQFGHTPVVPCGQTFGLQAPGVPLVPGLQRQFGNVPTESDGQSCTLMQFGYVPTVPVGHFGVTQFGHWPVVPGGQTFGLQAPGVPLVPGLQRQFGNVPTESDGQTCVVGGLQFGGVPVQPCGHGLVQFG